MKEKVGVGVKVLVGPGVLVMVGVLVGVQVGIVPATQGATPVLGSMVPLESRTVWMIVPFMTRA